MAKEYWLQRDGKATGPFSDDQLKQMAAAGMIDESDQVSADQVNWQAAGEIRGLFDKTQAASRRSDDSTTQTQEPVTADGNDMRPAPMGSVTHQKAPGATYTEPMSPEARILAFGIASLCTGIAAACLSWVAPVGILLAITGLGLGGFVLYQAHVSGEGKPRLSIAGVSVSGVAFLLTIGLAIGSSSSTGKQTRTPRPSSTMGERSKVAWEAMNDIDITLSPLPKSQPVEFLKKNYMEYARINMDGVDSELREHVDQWIQATRESWELAQSIEREMAKIRKKVEEATQIGKTLGSFDGNNPRGTSAGMGLIFGGLQTAMANEEAKALERKYMPQMKVMRDRLGDLQKQRRQLSSDLHRRYDRPFDIRL